MKLITAAILSLALAASPLALAQGTDAGKKAAPVTEKERADKKKAVEAKARECGIEVNKRKLKHGTKEFVDFMTQCLKP